MSKSKRIFLIVPDAAQQPTFGYRMVKAFGALDCEVQHFNYRWMQWHRFPVLNRVLNQRLVQRAAQWNPDLIVVMKGETLIPGTVRAIRNATGSKVVAWNLDDPFGDYLPENKIRNLDEYDAYFIFDTGYSQRIKRKCSRVYYLPCCTDPDLYREIIPWDARPGKEVCDVGFIGSRMPNRERFLKKFTAFDLNIWGYRWNRVPRQSPLAKCVQRQIYAANKSMHDLKATCRLHNLTKINLNVHHTHHKRAPNLRTFEIPATNSFMLTDRLPEMRRLFPKKNEIALYRDAREAKELIAFYLADPDARRAISKASQRRVLKEHTYVHRMRELLKRSRAL